MTKQSYSGQCPQCHGYNTRIRTEVINYASERVDLAAEHAAPTNKPRVASRTRIYLCNACQHVWSETVAE
jgi:hypothetical protein